jgi:hypothetical protein
LAKWSLIRSNRLKRLAGTFVIILLLVIALCVYFLKYVPGQKKTFHRSAFLELSQIQGALNQRNQAYRKAFTNYFSFLGEKAKKSDSVNIKTSDSVKILNSPFGNIFELKFRALPPKYDPGDSKPLGPTVFEKDYPDDKWKIAYPIYFGLNRKEAIFSIQVDALLAPIVSTYGDVLEDFLIVQDNHPDTASHATNLQGAFAHDINKSNVVYNSGNLAVDFRIDTDSLISSKDGLTFQSVRDVTIEGNPYKVFLYPFEFGKQRIILAGLISGDHYRAAFSKIPFSFISFTAVLILLLIIHLPLIRVFLLGPFDRIEDQDIRFIIGSYFLAAFVGFFLFARMFLIQDQGAKDNYNLNRLSKQVAQNFSREIDSIGLQLQTLDSTLYGLVQEGSSCKIRQIWRDSSVVTNWKSKNCAEWDSVRIDTVFKPKRYGQADNVFWIDSTGNWVAKRFYKKNLTNAPFVNVSDREYFKNFKDKRALNLPSDKTKKFTIQPTLSKLDGEYVITVVVESKRNWNELKTRLKLGKFKPPWLVGMSAQMSSVYRIIFPPGYGFSIINQSGDILYDSKPGRALISNITGESDHSGDILEAAKDRIQSYSSPFTLRGKEVALLATPMDGFPYQLLVYHDLSHNDTFQEHLVGLSAFITGAIIVLLIFSGLINELKRLSPAEPRSSKLHFEWLYPTIKKLSYYKHLINYMVIFMGLLVAIWLAIDLLFPQFEFLLFFISILYPFYIAVHYYLLRDEYYAKQRLGKPDISGIRYLLSHLQILLLVLILLINGLSFLAGFSLAKLYPLLLAQFIFIGAIWYSIFRFKKVKLAEGGIDPTERLTWEADPAKRKTFHDALVKRYCIAVLVGVFSISIIPALGVFWITFKQECALDQSSDLLSMANTLNQRAMDIDSTFEHYKSDERDSGLLDTLKFRKGIYSLNDSGREPVILESPPKSGPYLAVAPEYARIHQAFFPQAESILSWMDTTDASSDSSWNFTKVGSGSLSYWGLNYKSVTDEENFLSYMLVGQSAVISSVVQLLISKIEDVGGMTLLFYLGSLWLFLLIAYRLTRSLSRRIFQANLYCEKGWIGPKDNEADLGLHYEVSQRVVQIFWYQYWKHRPPSTKDRHLHPGMRQTLPWVCMRDIDLYEHDFSNDVSWRRVAWVSKVLLQHYQQLWQALSPNEKFILYCFACDGFANHRVQPKLGKLLEKGLIYFEDGRLSMVTESFRQFVLEQKSDSSLELYFKQVKSLNSTAQIRVPLLLLVAVIGIFIFITQDALYQKITGLFASLSSLFPLLTGFLGKGGGKSNGSDGGS